MNIAAIISEYNPFHNGHKYHIEKTRELGATHVVAVMSPNFVQRGECAVFDKFVRANIAVRNGVDLVIELPTGYALSCAENFALGAVKLINSLGCVDFLSFGSENGDLSLLEKVSKLDETEVIKELIQTNLSKGISFPKARADAFEKIHSKEIGEVLKKPNNLLAIEYLKAMGKTKSSYNAVTIKRKGAEHDSEISSDKIASASYIRENLSQSSIISQKFVPCNAFEKYMEEICKKNAPVFLKNAEKAIIYKLRSMNREDFYRVSDISEGIENRIIHAANNCTSLEELFEQIKNKRYTMARIKRIICCVFNDISSRIQKEDPPYIRVLAFNERGREILKRMNDTATLPFSVSLAKLSNENEMCKEFAIVESRCTDNFWLCSSKIFKKGLDYATKVAIIK